MPPRNGPRLVRKKPISVEFVVSSGSSYHPSDSESSDEDYDSDNNRVRKKAKVVRKTVPEEKETQPSSPVNTQVDSVQYSSEDSSDTSSSSSDDEDGQANPKPYITIIPSEERRKYADQNQPKPKYLLRTTRELYEKTKKYLASTGRKKIAHLPLNATGPRYDLTCNHGTFVHPVLFSLKENITSDTTMFAQMMNCSLIGDLDGFLTTETSAFPMRRQLSITNDMVWAAVYALVYHPEAKDEEVFRRCLESLFNIRTNEMGDADDILKAIKTCFTFKEEEEEDDQEPSS